MMKKKRIAAQFFNDVKTHDLKSLMKINLNGDKISKFFESDMKMNYIRMLDF